MQKILKALRAFLNLRKNKVSQLHLKGFKSPVSKKVGRFFKPINEFIRALVKYFTRKSRHLIGLGISGVHKLIYFARWSKDFLVRKLIWGRGRLGRPIINLFVLLVALLVFTFGEILSSTRFVNSQEIEEDYLKNVTDIIPNRNTATTMIPDSRKSTESFAYTIQSGDTLSAIGQQFKISTDALKYVNGLTDYSTLSVGDTITIPPVSGLIHEVADGDTLASIASKYDVPEQAVADFNYILDTSKIAVGTELVIPGAKVPTPVYTPVTPSYIPTYSGVAPTGGGWCMWPTSVNIVTQYFSWYHNGIDIATPWNSGMPPLYACSSGVVTRAGWDPWGLGLHVRIDHGNGFETVYGHMDRIDVGYGQHVSKGQMIGLMGNTGRSTGPHVHFMVKYNGVAQNPYNYF